MTSQTRPVSDLAESNDDFDDFDTDFDEDGAEGRASKKKGASKARPALTAAADAAGLGRKIRLHTYRKKGWLNLLYITAGGIIAAVMGPGFATIAPEEVPAIAWLTAPVFGALAILFFYRFLTAGRVACQIHQGGMVFSSYAGKIRAIPWGEIRAIRFDVVHVSGDQDMYRGVIELRLDGDERVNIPVELDESMNIVNVVMNATGARLLDEALAAVRAGKTVSFGAVSVDAEGATMGSKRVLWTEGYLSDWESKIRLCASKGSGSGKKDIATVGRAKVENWHVLEELSDTLHGEVQTNDDDDDDDDDDWDDDDE